MTKQLLHNYYYLLWLMSKDIEHVQKRCLKIIYPKLSYSEALEESGLVYLDMRR